MNRAFPKAIRSCTNCELQLQCRAPVPPEMRPSPVMVIGRNPGADEDRIGRPFVGRAGKLLDKFLEEAGSPRERTYVTNTVKCFTSDPPNRAPTPSEIAACKPWLVLEILWARPKIIVVTGREAIATFNHRASPGQWNGSIVPIVEQPFLNLSQQRSFCVFATVHPSYVLRNGKHGESEYIETAKSLRIELQRLSIGG